VLYQDCLTAHNSNIPWHLTDATFLKPPGNCVNSIVRYMENLEEKKSVMDGVNQSRDMAMPCQ
jgi:hypothetical protein